MLDLQQLLQAQKGLRFGETDGSSPPIAIAMNRQTERMLLEHPLISKKRVEDCTKLLPLSIRVLILDNIEDGLLPLTEERQVKAILKADSSYNPSIQTIDFMQWFSVLLQSIDLAIDFDNDIRS